MAYETKLDKERLRKFKLARWRARTDLLWFCNEILGYKDVNRKVHGPLLERLQHFPQPSAEEMETNDQFVGGTWVYKPLRPMLELEGRRKGLYLLPRSTLKTTINCVSHTLQWILNYPDIAVAILQANLDKVIDVVGEIKNHFTRNPRFRELFPEHCPEARKIETFGTMAEFTTRARGATVTTKEPTVRGASIEKGLAGSHFHLVKYSDIVDETNSNSPEACRAIFNRFILSENLPISPLYWTDVEGTRYSEHDTYGEIIRGQDMVPEEEREWNILVSGIFEKDTGGKPRKYSYDEVKLPDKLDEQGIPISIWPERIPSKNILSRFAVAPFLTSAQMYNYPNAAAGGQRVFPVNDKYPAWKTRADFNQRVLVSHYEIRVDTAETANERSNHSVITVGAWDAAGRLYIVDIRRGKWLAAELIANIVATYIQYRDKSRNGFVRVAIEETGYVRGIMYGFMQYCQQRGVHIPLETYKTDNTKSKESKIVNTLQYPYMTKNIIFLDDLKEKDTLIAELEGMPKPLSDDILDTLAAFYTGKEWLGRTSARAAEEGAANAQQMLTAAHNEEGLAQYRQRAFRSALGLMAEGSYGGNSPMHPDLAKTGGL
jgi:predicted phage terminase large subunit-like protein